MTIFGLIWDELKKLSALITSGQLSVSDRSPTAWQTPKGALVAGAVVVLKNSPGELVAIEAIYQGTSSVYLTIHDSADGVGLTTASMVGFGIPVNAVEAAVLFREWGERPLVFAAGICLALSTTQVTYTASSDQMVAFARGN